jgi:hypothetical protein
MPGRYLLSVVLLMLTSFVSEGAQAGFFDHLPQLPGKQIGNTVPSNGINDLSGRIVNPAPLPLPGPPSGGEIEQTITNPCRTNPNLPQCSGAVIVAPAPQ